MTEPLDPATPPPVAPVTPPATPEAGNEDAGMTVAQVETLLSRLEKLSEARPPSTRDQLQTRLTSALALQSDGAANRREGRDVADSAEGIARSTRDELRRRDIVDAARIAKFIDPTDAVSELMGKEGDPATLVAALAVSKAHWVARSTEMDHLKDSSGAAITDPGMVDLAKSIAAGRNM
jgi:hypothetical protein